MNHLIREVDQLALGWYTYWMALDRSRAQEVLAALGEQLAGTEILELVVIGGSGLTTLGLIDRSTRDVDIVAFLDDGRLIDPRPLPERLTEAQARVAADFALPVDWLNAAPASLLDFGLPDGFVERLERRPFAPSLVVWVASRLDQIHFKLYAAVDQGPGKHEADLRALAPTHGELLQAARWARTHDPSPGFAKVLVNALRSFGVDGGDLGP